MKNEGYREATIRRYSKIVRTLSKTADLLDAEAAKAEIADKVLSKGTKELACDGYSLLAGSIGFSFDRPRYERIEKLPFIPLESEIEHIDIRNRAKTSTTLQLLKETAARIGEVWNLKWTDIDLERSVVTQSPEKGSKPRRLRISSKLKFKPERASEEEYPCLRTGNVEKFRHNYELQPKRLAAKLCNPRLLQITLHTFRHWKATYEYHKTRDILHVMQYFGRKSIRNTLRYTQLVDWKSDDYTCKTAKSLSEASSLIEAGFEYVTELDGVKLFRKRK